MDVSYLETLQKSANDLQKQVSNLEVTKLELAREVQETRKLLKEARRAAMNLQEAEISTALTEINKVHSTLTSKREEVAELSKREREIIGKLNGLEFELTERQVAYDAEMTQFNRDRNNVLVLLHRLDGQIQTFHSKMESMRDAEKSTYELQAEAARHKQSMEQMAYAVEIQANTYSRLTQYSRECLQKEYKMLKLKQQLLDERESRLAEKEEEAHIQWQQLLQAKQHKDERSEPNTSSQSH